jgi:GTPase SAR1 family protein
MTYVKNPFKYGAPVEGEYYFPLPGFNKLVRSYLDNRINVVLYGPRRCGKTSFILDLVKEEERQKKTFILVDVYNVTSHLDFLQQVLRGLRSKQTWGQKLKDTVFKARLIPSATLDPMGQMTYSLSPDFSSPKDVKELIQDTFSAFSKLDESVIFQLDDSGWLQHTVRTQMQELKNCVFLFSGSKKSVLSDMLNDQNSPFYKSCEILDMPILGDDFTDWIIERFKSVNIHCDKKAVIELRKLVHDTPNYIQQTCFHIATQDIKLVDSRQVQLALHTIVKQNAYTFETIHNSLTLLQQRALRLCANEDKAIFSKEFISRYQIPNAPTLAQSIKALKQRGILDPTPKPGQVSFEDPLFKIWIQIALS